MHVSQFDISSSQCLGGHSSTPDQGGHIDPHRQHIVGVRMDVDGQSKLHITGVVGMYSCGEHCIHNWVDLIVRHVDGKSWNFVRGKRTLQLCQVLLPGAMTKVFFQTVRKSNDLMIWLRQNLRNTFTCSSHWFYINLRNTCSTMKSWVTATYTGRSFLMICVQCLFQRVISRLLHSIILFFSSVSIFSWRSRTAFLFVGL